ncbi:hypothetical protein L249_0331 [Ophiocordyceps polyrhachis-furcata BCC 54312]|uniref:C2H2-type domain-containing protein n=1 Tax=Ophiocordyceps polyrhachis-furcata BCC 54312 TaxID=1330021 RepID=A0A367LDR3_9HYPO|nr:hypothetical protein L249_0331 [Ophiocordyceps polyrhachis-furcata BCC 54312]
MSTSKAAGSSSRDIRRYFSAQQQARPTPKMQKQTSSGSADDEDPLLGDSTVLRIPSLRPGVASQNSNLTMTSTSTMSAGGGNLAVVLAASPSRAGSPSSSARVVKKRLDLRRRASGRPLATTAVVKETPVPLPKIAGWNGARSGRTTTTTTAATSTTTTTTPTGLNSRGRPKGWRAGMSYSAMRGRTPPGAKSGQAQAKPALPGISKRRGRPQRLPSPPPREIYLRQRPRFVEFLCEWAGCKAELHNLETLRRHVYVVHGPRSSSCGCCCRWGDCARSVATVDEFREHTEEAHLVPIAWHLGDGPRNSRGGIHDDKRKKKKKKGDDDDDDDDDVDEDGIPAFLKDARGVQVTPSVRDQEVEDVLTWRMNRRKLKELLIRRDENLPDEDSDVAGEEEEGERGGG